MACTSRVNISRRSLLISSGLTAGSLAVDLRFDSVASAKAEALTGNHRVLSSGRSYWLSSPGHTRLVIGLHGTALSAQNCNDTFWLDQPGGWQGHASSTGYTLALGEALGGKWNVGAPWPGGSQNDLQYLIDVVEDAGQFNEVFISGFSAGAAMAWTACVKRPDIFVAGAGASGWAAVYPTTPIDFWHIHGTGDTTVPVRGGAGTMGVSFPEAAQEAERAPRGSRVVLYPTSGGHGTPGWMASRQWQFWTASRARS